MSECLHNAMSMRTARDATMAMMVTATLAMMPAPLASLLTRATFLMLGLSENIDTHRHTNMVSDLSVGSLQPCRFQYNTDGGNGEGR